MNWVLVSLPLAVSAALTVAVAVLYLSTKELLGDVRVPAPEGSEPDVRAIRDAFARVFHRPAEGDLPEPERVVDALPKKIELLGVALGKRNMALLKVNGRVLPLEEGREKEGILLRKVLPREAVVLVGGRELRLRLVRGRSPKRRASRDAVAESFEARISRREIERLTKDPGVMFREIRLVPYVRGGRTEGFIFEWIKPGSLFYRAGLRKGDILISINNMTIKSGEDAFRLLQVLRNEPSLRVVVLRGGQRREINVRIE